MTEYLFGSPRFGCKCEHTALHQSDYEALDLRDLYEKSKALLFSLTNHFSGCKPCSNCEQSSKQKTDSYARLKTILAILIRRLNNLKDKEPIKYFIALFSNFCFIFPHVDSSAFLIKFNNKFYRRVINSINFCYQQWAKTQNQSQKQLLRLSTLLCSLSKLAKDLKTSSATKVINKQRLFSQKLIKTVLLLKLPKNQSILASYHELFNFIFRETSKKSHDPLTHILKFITPEQLYQALYFNLVNTDNSLTHRSYYLSFSILQRLFTQHFSCKSQQSLRKMDFQNIEMMSLYCQKTIIRYGFEVYTGQQIDLAIIKIAINFMIVLSEPYLQNYGLRNVSCGLVSKLLGHPERSEFIQGNMMNKLVKDFKDLQLKTVIVELMRPLIGSFRDFEACSQKLKSETNAIQQQRSRAQMCKIYRRLTPDLSYLQNSCLMMSQEVCYWLIDNNKWGMMGSEQKSWTILNRMFKQFLRFEKICPITSYRNSNVYWLQSLMARIIQKFENVPEILFVLKNQFCQLQFNSPSEQTDIKAQNILQEILKRRATTISPQHAINLINPLHYMINDFISRSNMLGNNHYITKKWNLAQSPPKDTLHLI